MHGRAQPFRQNNKMTPDHIHQHSFFSISNRIVLRSTKRLRIRQAKRRRVEFRALRRGSPARFTTSIATAHVRDLIDDLLIQISLYGAANTPPPVSDIASPGFRCRRQFTKYIPVVCRCRIRSSPPRTASILPPLPRIVIVFCDPTLLRRHRPDTRSERTLIISEIIAS